MKKANLVILNQQPVDYKEAYSYQETIHQLRAEGKIDDTLLLLEHQPVYTIGKDGGWHHIKMPLESLARQGIEVIETDRGGSITFHGPGQLVCYPIFNMDLVEGDLHLFLRKLEAVVIGILDLFNVRAERFKPYPGVWVGSSKIAAVGVSCRSLVSLHGIALNINPSLKYFDWIEPCGITSYGVTTLSKELGVEVKMSQLWKPAVEKFAETFSLNFQDKVLGELIMEREGATCL